MSRNYRKKRKPGNNIAQNEETMTLKEISDTYGIPTSMIRRCFPAPQTRYYMDKNGNRRSTQVWSMRKIEKALHYQAITQYLEKKKQEEEENILIDEISLLYEQYSPDMYIEKAKKLKRTFIFHVGPTNSGKTYDAIEDMKKNTPGTYLGPLRLLALEMYDKMNASGVPCSMITGEESLITEGAEVVSSTIELCDFRKHYKTAVIDEAQLIADPFRGSAWLKAICLVDADIVHICMAPEALSYIKKLVASFDSPSYTVNHERLSPLYFGGEIKGYEDLRPGDALICFSRKSVLSTTALLEKNGFKASVIYGALPPEARRNEVRKFLNRDTNMVVATDAIGMGISLPIKRVIFTEIEKYDGRQFRTLTTSEVNQIGGRAGRYGLNEYGEVLSMSDAPLIDAKLGRTVKSIQASCIAFPREVLDTSYPLPLLLKAWQKARRNDGFVRENVQEAEFLLRSLKNVKGLEENRNLVYDLITCPVDTKSNELVGYFVKCAKAIMEDRMVPLPSFGTETLKDCELEYKAYDIRHQLLRRIGIPDDSMKRRRAICDRISELMLENKEEYILHCRICGKELPIGSMFNYCEECYFGDSESY
ncbi:MAG: ATP-dependent helicase [Eubacterium sp.]|nr:ATP-dependent helicase [Eubacterium sp.]